MALSVELTGSILITCVHGREKRKTVELEFDTAVHKVHLCACCENLFLTLTDEPTRCIMCKPRGKGYG